MGTKWACFLWALVAVIELGLNTRAAEMTGSITVQPQWCGTPVSGGSVSVQQVGEETSEGYVVTDGLANWKMETEELDDEQWIGWLAQRTQSPEICAAVSEEGAVFQNLMPGIYLIRHTQPADASAVFQPFLMTVPSEGNWDLAVKPKLVRYAESPRTGDRPAPIIGAMGIGLSAAILMVLADEHKK